LNPKNNKSWAPFTNVMNLNTQHTKNKKQWSVSRKLHKWGCARRQITKRRRRRSGVWEHCSWRWRRWQQCQRWRHRWCTWRPGQQVFQCWRTPPSCSYRLTIDSKSLAISMGSMVSQMGLAVRKKSKLNCLSLFWCVSLVFANSDNLVVFLIRKFPWFLFLRTSQLGIKQFYAFQVKAHMFVLLLELSSESRKTWSAYKALFFSYRQWALFSSWNTKRARCR